MTYETRPRCCWRWVLMLAGRVDVALVEQRARRRHAGAAACDIATRSTHRAAPGPKLGREQVNRGLECDQSTETPATRGPASSQTRRSARTDPRAGRVSALWNPKTRFLRG